MKPRYLFLIVGFSLFSPVLIGQNGWSHGRLQVSPNGRFLQYADGKPFFWLGDTGWELFERLTREEIADYLENRRQKGFTLIQCVALAEFDGLRKPNRYGQLALLDMDPEKPNEKYFELLDYTIHLAAEKGLVIGLLPTWGDKVLALWGKGPVIFNPDNAYSYGRWLGRRYASDPNIIWILGGDRPPLTDTSDYRPIWRAMARGIREGTGKQVLISYHPWGESSTTDFLQGESWLDINMMQSGHRVHDLPVWNWILRDRAILPVKPVLDGEPNYEDHPIGWKKENGYFDAYDVRRQIYRSVFSGACGVTYGNHSVWQFWSGREDPITFARIHWREALDRPGAFQAGYLRKLILSRPPMLRLPDSTLILSGRGKRHDHIVAFRDSLNRYAMIYLPVGKNISVSTVFIKGKQVRSWWFNPRKGECANPEIQERGNHLNFVPPETGEGKDWVLVLDDASYSFGEPGKIK